MTTPLVERKSASGPVIKVFVLPGGSMPQKAEGRGIGYDIKARALVSSSWDTTGYQRDTLWDLRSEPLRISRSKCVMRNGTWAYRLGNGDSILMGLGVVLGGKSTDWYAEVALRSSTALHGVEPISHFDGVPIDPQFRGEPIAKLTHCHLDPLLITAEKALVQLKFFCKCCGGRGFLEPTLVQVHSYEELGITLRGSRCHGSTDLVAA